MSRTSRPSFSGSGLRAATAQVRWMEQLPDLVDREGFGITILVVDREASWKRRLGESCHDTLPDLAQWLGAIDDC